MTNQLQLNFAAHSKDIPQFIMKVYSILERNQFNKIVSWSESGEEIQIKNIKKFENQILPFYFRHSRIKSFVRQLNMYRFNKTHQISKDKNHLYFKNEFFKRGDINSLILIKRKKKNDSESEDQSTTDKQLINNDSKHTKNKLFFDLVDEIIKLRVQHPELTVQMNSIFNLINVMLTDQKEPIEIKHEDKYTVMNIMETIKQIPNGFGSLKNFGSYQNLDQEQIS